jgi:hypothetical protein
MACPVRDARRSLPSQSCPQTLIAEEQRPAGALQRGRVRCDDGWIIAVQLLGRELGSPASYQLDRVEGVEPLDVPSAGVVLVRAGRETSFGQRA